MLEKSILRICKQTVKSNILRKYSTKYSIKLDEQVSHAIENNTYKPRKHPGIFKSNNISVPDNIVTSIHNVFQDYPLKAVCEDSKALVNFLYHRHPPAEDREIKEKQKEIENIIINKHAEGKEYDRNEKKNILSKYEPNIRNLLKTQLPQWSSINYTTYTALQYLVSRAAPEYAVLVRIFQELDERYPNFNPRTFFDFGSGVGTGTWAAKLLWEKSLYEYFCVDISSCMNDLADILLKNGYANKPSTVRGLFHRQFLPASNTQYDIVLSAYSLLELPSSNNRFETVLNLWNKTRKFLIIVEQGNSSGFRVTNEARDFILNLPDEKNTAHVFMPCPHDKPCPRFLNDNTPCNFEVSYRTLPLLGSSEYHRERYSYVVLQKSPRNENDVSWPRIVRPTLVKSKHTICRLCTSKGTLEEVIFTASKHGKTSYHCARASKWGDLLPITIEPKS
ncbi:methyltransferase-like protein 17, mitochondrial [Chrysoperla carnea]|uniref:methyltransferase-like protein 17, mitochondrial n=1 Tax=Chrysoperla carnea TaxID=189513 RepID=UPI001D082C47|nr:methyltransferase-like protein 17, mitochondrial [Chrysoperla carnea]XP_044730623.1 methyltransferase-like protein 17, mitochondrial [Chrysoperla carnea]